MYHTVLGSVYVQHIGWFHPFHTTQRDIVWSQATVAQQYETDWNEWVYCTCVFQMFNTRTAEKKKSRTAEEGKFTRTCISGYAPDRLKIPTSDNVPCPVGLQEPSGNLCPLSNLLDV